MKVLVTGGAGFIGSHIVDALIKQGGSTVVIDNLVTGLRRNVNQKAAFYQISILDEKIADVFGEERPDVVVHEAAQTDVSRSVHDPLYDAQVNITGSLNVLEACVKYGVKKIVYASSCAIYGTPHYLPLNENHPLNSISPYGVSKQTVEKYLRFYRDTYGLQYCVLRYSNVYGPRQNPGGEAGVVAIFSNKMLSGQPVNIYGKGDKTRSYVFVDDIVKANLLALNYSRSGIFNIGASQEITDQKIFDLISFHCSYHGNPNYVDERLGEIRRMCLDSGKALSELGWIPETPLEQGIEKTVRAYAGENTGRRVGLANT